MSIDVGLAGIRLENLGEALEHGVARMMSEGVVDLLEQIQVSHHHPDRKVMPSGGTQAKLRRFPVSKEIQANFSALERQDLLLAALLAPEPQFS